MKKELSFFLFRFSYFYFLTSQILFFILILIDGKISLNNNFSNRIIEKKKNSEKRIEFFSSSFSFLIFLFFTSQILFFILISIDGKISLNNNFLKRIEKKGKIMKKELNFFLLLFCFSYFCSSQAKYYFLFWLRSFFEKFLWIIIFWNRIIEKKGKKEK